jgi:hemolysin activation/secretion protein
MGKMTNYGLKLMAVHSALACSWVSAQTDSGTILQQQNRQELRQPDRIPELPKTEATKAQAALSGPRVTVKTLKFTGPEALTSSPEMQSLSGRWVGQEVDFAGLDRLAKQATDLLRSRQWFLAQAYLPQQDVTEGHIEIAIQPGYFDGANGLGAAFSVVMDAQKSTRISKNKIEEIARHNLKPGALANEANLERTLLIAGDLPGVTARAQLEPGANQGATRIVLNVEEGPVWSGSVIVDNYGSRFTGNAQVNAGLQINDPKGLGDQYSFNVTHTEGLDLARFGYSLPISANGLRLNASWSPMNYKIVQGLGVDAGLKGSSETTAVSLSYPIQRSRAQNVFASVALNHKALKDDSSSGLLKDKRANTLIATVSADQLDNFAGGGLSNASLGLTAGQINLSRLTADQEADAAAYSTQGHFQKINYSLNRLQKLGGQFTLLGNFYGQVAGKNLDSSEKFGLGGPSGVRAYVGGEATGDSGWVANLEIRYDWQSLSSIAGQVQLVAFYDAGRISLHHDDKGLPIPTATGRNSYGLAGWGLGANLSKSGSHSLRVVWAHKSGSNPGRTTEGMDSDGRASASRLWFQGTWWY